MDMPAEQNICVILFFFGGGGGEGRKEKKQVVCVRFLPLPVRTVFVKGRSVVARRSLCFSFKRTKENC